MSTPRAPGSVLGPPSFTVRFGYCALAGSVRPTRKLGRNGRRVVRPRRGTPWSATGSRLRASDSRRDSRGRPRARARLRGKQASAGSDRKQRRRQHNGVATQTRRHYRRARDLQRDPRISVSGVAPSFRMWFASRLQGPRRAGSFGCDRAGRPTHGAAPVAVHVGARRRPTPSSRSLSQNRFLDRWSPEPVPPLPGIRGHLSTASSASTESRGWAGTPAVPRAGWPGPAPGPAG